MTPDGTGAGRLQRQKKGAHKKGRIRSRAGLTVTAVAGGAVACTGVAFGVAPIAEAFSMMIPVSDGSGGTGNNIQVNVLEGNVFDTQLGILDGNVSNNTTGGGIATGQGNGNGGTTAASGNGNTTQINILSYNIWNPQVSIFGGNMSTNTTVSNVSANNGNGVTNAAAPSGLIGGMLLGGMNGNGNTTQLAFLSGNITNPQYTLFGANTSSNTAFTNIAMGNGNGSAQYSPASYLGWAVFGMNGNGNTTQVAAGTSNIFNPQYSFGAGNSSVNSSATNVAIGNGNGSDTENAGGLFGNLTFFGLTGNGVTSQTANGSGNIFNDQMNVGWTKLIPINTPTPSPTIQQQAVGADKVVTSSSPGPADTSGTVNTLAAAGPAAGTGTPDPTDSSPRPARSATRITTVDDQTAADRKPLPFTPFFSPGGGPGATGHFNLADPVKRLIASIPGMPKADAPSSAPKESE